MFSFSLRAASGCEDSFTSAFPFGKISGGKPAQVVWIANFHFNVIQHRVQSAEECVYKKWLFIISELTLYFHVTKLEILLTLYDNVNFLKTKLRVSVFCL